MTNHYEIEFREDQALALAEASGDRNPLHLDPAYVHTTPFGSPVAPGILLVLCGLGRWARGASFSIRSIHAEFLSPLFFRRSYRLEISERADAAELVYHSGGRSAATLRFEYEPRKEKESWPSTPARFERLVGSPATIRHDSRYAPDPGATRRLLSLTGLSPGQLPWLQVSALLWSTYAVGSEFPGRQALYSSLDFLFETPAPMSDELRLSGLRLSYDDRFALATLAGAGAGIRSFTLQAFRRPPPVRYSLADFPPTFPRPPSLRGKSAFITGASRGFGSVLALACGRSGMDVYLGCVSETAEAERLRHEIESSGGKAHLVVGNITDPEVCRQAHAEVSAKTGGLDLLVLNAAPPAQPFGADPVGAEREEYLARAAALARAPQAALAPLLRRGGATILVSSVFTRQAPPRGFSAYVEAKKELEAFARVLPCRERGVIVVRPPRMLTDQTNFLSWRTPPASPVAVAARLFARLPAPGDGKGFLEIDL